MDSPDEVFQGIRDHFSVSLGGLSGRWFAVHYVKAGSFGGMANWNVKRTLGFPTRDEAKDQVTRWMNEEKTEALLKGEAL